MRLLIFFFSTIFPISWAAGQTTCGSMTITAMGDTSMCGPCSGSVSVDIAGGVGPFDIQWTGDSTFSGQGDDSLCPGSYTVTVTDLGQGVTCSESTTVADYEPIHFLDTIITPDLGPCDGSIELLIGGGVPPYVLDWNHDGQGDWDDSTFVDGLCQGWYTLQIRDSRSCPGNGSPSNCPYPDTCYWAPDSSCCLGGSGLPAWQEYTFYVPGCNGLNLTLFAMPESCSGASDGMLQANASGGNGSLTYDIGSGGQSSGMFFPLIPDLYTVTVTDELGCTASVSEVVPAGNPIDLLVMATVDASCGLDNGSVVVEAFGGIGAPYTYNLYTPSGPVLTQTQGSFTGLQPGPYTVDAYDQNGCPAFATFTIGAGPDIDSVAVVVDSISCVGTCDGGIQVQVYGGVPPYSYDLGNGVQPSGVFSGLCAGAYVVQVWDANACYESSGAVLSDPVPVGITLIAFQDETTPGASDGVIDISMNGGTPGYTFDWDNDGVGDWDDNEDLSGLSAGTYLLTVADANGCTDTLSVVIGVSCALQSSVVPVPATCHAICTGSAQVVVQGGSGYTYTWSPNVSTSDVATNLCAGSYQVIVSSGAGCADTLSFAITEPNAFIFPVVTVTPETQPGNGAIDVVVTGGTPPYLYDWDVDGTGDNDDTTYISGLTGGYYNLLITDANGCMHTVNVLVTSFLSLSENAKDFLVYPNPTNGSVNLEFSTKGQRTIRVLDASGRAVVEESTDQEGYAVDLGHLENGVYLLEIQTDNSHAIRSILKH